MQIDIVYNYCMKIEIPDLQQFCRPVNGRISNRELYSNENCSTKSIFGYKIIIRKQFWFLKLKLISSLYIVWKQRFSTISKRYWQLVVESVLPFCENSWKRASGWKVIITNDNRESWQHYTTNKKSKRRSQQFTVTSLRRSAVFLSISNSHGSYILCNKWASFFV